VRAQLRRRELDRSLRDVRTAVEVGPVHLDLSRHSATVRGKQINITPSEFQLLRLLIEHPGQVFSRRQIMEELWGPDFFANLPQEVMESRVRACDVHISNLRHKIERNPQKPEIVVTVRGSGYKFSETAEL
jgi:two-component system response regulator RegX3